MMGDAEFRYFHSASAYSVICFPVTAFPFVKVTGLLTLAQALWQAFASRKTHSLVMPTC